MKRNNHLVQQSDLDITWRLLDFSGTLNTLYVLEHILVCHLSLATLKKVSQASYDLNSV